MLTQEQLKSVLAYNPETGVFVWTVDRTASAKKGAVAGTTAKRWRGIDYVVLSVFGKKYYAHQLAVLYMTGNFPAKTVDHIDGNGLNNCWTNIREAEVCENAWNAKTSVRNTSGRKNVSWYKRLKKWRVTVSKNGKTVDKYFADFDLAELVAEEARVLLHGNFAKHA